MRTVNKSVRPSIGRSANCAVLIDCRQAPGDGGKASKLGTSDHVTPQARLAEILQGKELRYRRFSKY
jgi:hypothetical protein